MKNENNKTPESVSGKKGCLIIGLYFALIFIGMALVKIFLL